MFGLKFFSSKKAAPALVTTGRFELERDGHVAYLEYTVTGNILELIHSEVPEALRGSGIAGTLAKTAFDWAREHHKKVDIVCPFVAEYISHHPEFNDLILR